MSSTVYSAHPLPQDARASTPVLIQERRRGIRITTVVVSLVVLTFYLGFIVMMLMRAIR